MGRSEAILLLGFCIILARRVAAEGVNIELSEEDRENLAGFNRVYKAGWLDDPDFHRQAGLGRSDITNLGYLASQIPASCEVSAKRGV
jgi:hypothetical protein